MAFDQSKRCMSIPGRRAGTWRAALDCRDSWCTVGDRRDLGPDPRQVRLAAATRDRLIAHRCCVTRSIACRAASPSRSASSRGKVLLVVNTASYCGYTNQYEGLEALYRKYADRGLVVVGFPSNDFGGQEPGTNQEIAEFCRTTYGVQFPMFEKTAAPGSTPIRSMRNLLARTGERPKWNFHKYVVSRGARPWRASAAPSSPATAT